MASLTLRASGRARAEDAWERYARPALWSSWSPQIFRVDVDADRLSTGVTGRVHSLAGIYVDFTVEAWDEQTLTWSWSVRPMGSERLELLLAHGVTQRAVTGRDGGCATWLRVRGPLPLVLAYAAPATLALHRLVQE